MNVFQHRNRTIDIRRFGWGSEVMMPEVEGLLYIDKPSGPTSHDVVRTIRRLAGIRRVGHTGTLDPLATGLLIVCLGRATRLAEYLTGLDKQYVASIRLGQETDTYDAEGSVITEKPVNISASQLDSALDHFSGEIEQIPPMFSAVKIDGQPLYTRARQGEVIERPSRLISIYDLRLIQWSSPNMEIQVHCSSGTYLRTIAHDLGQYLGCGGYLASLRRISVGDHLLEESIPLNDLTQENLTELIRSTDTAVRHLPREIFNSEQALAFFHGQSVPIQIEQQPGSLVRAYDDKSRFVGIIESVDNHWFPRKIFYQPRL